MAQQLSCCPTQLLHNSPVWERCHAKPFARSRNGRRIRAYRLRVKVSSLKVQGIVQGSNLIARLRCKGLKFGVQTYMIGFGQLRCEVFTIMTARVQWNRCLRHHRPSTPLAGLSHEHQQSILRVHGPCT